MQAFQQCSFFNMLLGRSCILQSADAVILALYSIDGLHHLVLQANFAATSHSPRANQILKCWDTDLDTDCQVISALLHSSAVSTELK